MQITLSITSMILLAAIAWQDFRTRFISAWLLFALSILLIASEFFYTDTYSILRNVLINCILLGLQFLMLSGWISFRNRKWTGIINSHIGSGDIVLLLVLTPVFSPMNFCLFLTVGTLFTLIAHSIIRIVNPKVDAKFPFAGYLGLSVLIFSMLNIIGVNPVRLSDNNWLLNYFIV